MIIKRTIVIGFATLALTACGGSADPATEPTSETTVADTLPEAESTTPEPEPEPEPSPTPEPVPVPEPDPVSSPEDYYLQTLDALGVYYSSPDNAITAGYAVCDAFDVGLPLETVGTIAVDEGGYSWEDAGYIIGAAIGAFCPEHSEVAG